MNGGKMKKRYTLFTLAVIIIYGLSAQSFAGSRVEKLLPEYTEFMSTEGDINGQQTILHTFRARNTVTDDLLHFTQSYFVKENVGYTVTCVLPENTLEEERSICLQAINSFKLK